MKTLTKTAIIIKNFFVILSETAVIRKFFVGLVVVIVIWYIFSTIISVGSWKAVFLDNGQVYFGKFIEVPFSRTITLREVFYVKNTGNGSSTLEVARIVNDVQGPTDKVIISKDHLMYFQVLRSTSPFVKGLNEQVAK